MNGLRSRKLWREAAGGAHSAFFGEPSWRVLLSHFCEEAASGAVLGFAEMERMAVPEKLSRK